MSEKMNRQGGRTNWGMRDPMIWLAAALSLGSSGSAFAVAPTPAVTWDATGTSDYNTPTNWDPDLASAPANASNQFLTINNGATAAINSNAEGAFLILGLSTGQSGNLVINSGTISTFGEIRVGGRETVPDDYNSATPMYVANNGGTGTVIQNPGSTVNVNYNAGTEPPVASFYVGDSSGGNANGSYTITGTAESPSVLTSGFAANDAIVVGTGNGTIASFTQNAFTTVTSTGFIIAGRKGATGTYTMNGGVLNAQGASGSLGLFVGDGDTTGIPTTSGTFTQNAGTFFLTNGGSIGRRGGTGVYNMVGGTLNQSTGTIVIGDGVGTATKAGTNGTFTQTGGDVNAANVTVAQIGGTGAYTMSAGTLSLTGQMMVGAVGSTTAGLLDANGTLNLSGTGAITIGTNLNVAIGSSTVQTAVVGIMNMSGGSMQFNAANAIFAVGNGLVSSSTVNLSGGTINILGATSQIDIGRSKAPGTFNVSGTGTLNAHQVTIDSSDSTATRSLNISGGTVDLDILTFGTVASPTPRLVDISGGTVNIGALTTGQATGVGSAVTYIHGGNVTLENTVEYFSGSVFRLGSINLAVPASTTYGNATVDVLAGSTLTQTGSFGTGADARTLTKTGPGTLTVNGAQSYATNAVANIMGGTINYNTDAGAGGANLDVNANGGNANFGAPQNLRQIEIAGGGVVNINTTNVSTTALSLDGSPQNYGLTYGSLTSSAAIKSNVYFGGTGIITVGTAGDYNNSGQVDAADYVVWRANSAAFGGSVGYNLWRQNFGALSVPGAGASLGGNQAIPEPGTLLLAVAGVALACVGCQRR